MEKSQRLRLVTVLAFLSLALVCCISDISYAEEQNSSIELLTNSIPADDSLVDPLGTKYFYYRQLNNMGKAIYLEMTKLSITNPVISLSYNDDLDDQFQEACRMAYFALIEDQPLYHMYLNGIKNVDIDDVNHVVRIELSVIDGVTEKEIAKALAKKDSIVSIADEQDDYYTKIRKISLYLGKETQYDTKIGLSFNRQVMMNDSCIGVFLFNQSVCNGTAHAFKVLCDELNVPCICVGNNGHEWNYVRMEDEQWYAVDETFFTGLEGVGIETFQREMENKLLLGSQSPEYNGNNAYYLGELFNPNGDLEYPKLNPVQYRYNNSFDWEYVCPSFEYNEGELEFHYTVNEDGTTCTIVGCSGKQSGDLLIPDSIDGFTVSSIGEGAFYHCTGFSGDIIIPQSVTSIGDAAFFQCEGVSGGVRLSSTLKELGDKAFAYCTNMKTLIIDCPKERIPDWAFCSCSSLISVEMCDGIKVIGTGSFSFCSSLTEIVLPSSVVEIGDRAFRLCGSLSSIMNTQSIQRVGENAFDSCAFKEFTIPSTLTDIGKDAFLYCSELEEFVVNSANENYSSYDGALYNRDKTVLISIPLGKKQIELSDSMETIHRDAFCGSELKTITIPKSVTKIEAGAFAQCWELEDIIVDKDNEYYCSYAGNLFSIDRTKCIAIAGGKEYATEFPDELEVVGELCILNSPIKEIVLPDSVKEFGAWAIDNCYSLERFSVPTGVTQIGNGLFYWCGLLQEVFIPRTVTTIYENAFEDTSISTVYYEGTEQEWKEITIIEHERELANVQIQFQSKKKSGHMEVLDIAVEPTCTETGLTEGSHCSVCNEVLKAQEIVPAKGHTEVRDEALEPTCTKTGLTEGSHCSVCNEVLKAQEIVPARGHTEVKDEAVAPTSISTGLSEGSHCAVCGVIIKAQKVIPKLVKDGFVTDGAEVYYYKDGKKQKKWQKIGGKWYYFGTTGVMVKDWQQISKRWYYFDTFGVMQTGWQKIGKEWYFFKTSGEMAANEWCKGYWLNKNGTWTYKKKATWHKDKNGWWFGCSGWYAKNLWQKIDNKWYYFEERGYIVTGTRTINGKTYQFSNDGVLIE